MAVPPNISKPIFEHLRGENGHAITGHSSPRLSWRFEYDEKTRTSWEQTGYEIEITSDRFDEPEVFRVPGSNSVLVPWPRSALASRELVTVRVRSLGVSKTNSSAETWTSWSEYARVEAGLLDSKDWSAQWITSSKRYGPDGPLQPLRFYKEIVIPADIKAVSKARLYISALGVFDAYINGVKASSEFMAPGWTSYNHRLAYRALDVTDLLKPDAVNIICVEVAEGWYAGRLGFLGGKRFCYGADELGLLAQLEVYSVTSTEVSLTICTGEDWTCSPSAIQLSEIYDGEVYDARLERENWQMAKPQDGSTSSAPKIIKPPSDKMRLFLSDAPPVRVTETIRPKDIFRSKSGKTIIDFGQNLVGKLMVKKIAAPPGAQVSFRHAEVMEHGELGVRPLRLAKCTDTVISAGNPITDWTPEFTFHGFRYVQVDGWPSSSGHDLPQTEDIVALVTHTDMRRRGYFSSSNKSLNQLHQNVVWSMRGNFLSIPTDCPQRDERLGWTGDLQVFCPSATFLYDTVGMLGDWLQDLASEQLEDGKGGIPPLVCPDVLPPNWPHMPQAVWDDITVLTPYELYHFSDDQDILERQFNSMQAYLNEAVDRGPDRLWNFDRWQLGDWLDPAAPPGDPGSGRTDGVLVSDAYLVHVTEVFSSICKVLGKTELAVEASRDAASLKHEFQQKYITPKGNLMSNSQTGLALAIRFGLYQSESQVSVAGAALEKLVRSARFRIATGFAGTPIITHALTAVGRSQLAYRMLLETKCPSWMYPVTMGATTIWERWNSMLEDGSINPGQMTSFNHYALGAVANWLHGTVGGISPLEPGWRVIQVRPVPGGNLTSAETSFEGPYGWIKCKWELQGGDNFILELHVPPNSQAVVTLPSGGQDKEPKAEPEVVGSGVYHFSTTYVPGPWPPTPIVASNQKVPTEDTIAV